uniref:Uncharacterized protein n=1 Tax=Physcomitrium patens TaxID=3218 RepID=A0A2K1KFK4_PHYPA|nr:hypothetical protein PHYPA_008919 [Physcomitrium patens]
MKVFYSLSRTNHLLKQVEDCKDGAPLSTYSMIASRTDTLPLIVVGSFDCVMGFDI